MATKSFSRNIVITNSNAIELLKCKTNDESTKSKSPKMPHKPFEANYSIINNLMQKY